MRRLQLQDKATLVQGDCLEVYPKLSLVDFIFTDPPFGHDNQVDDLARRRELTARSDDVHLDAARPIPNDDFETANQLFAESLPWWRELLPAGGFVCCCCGGGGGAKGLQFARWSQQLADALEFEQAIVWDKGPMGMGWRYRRSHEYVLAARCAGAKPRWFDETRRVENIIRPGDYGIHKIIPTADQHPTEKCPELAAHFIRLHTRPGDTVFDPFMGSGSTGVAALQLDRKFIGVELDPRWATRAAERLRFVLERGYDMQPATKKTAQTTKQLSTPSFWGDRR